MATQKIRFGVHSGPAGEDPRGRVVVDVPGFTGGKPIGAKSRVTWCRRRFETDSKGSRDMGR